MAEAQKYPKREAFFSHRFCRLLHKVCAAQEIGTAATLMLTFIVHQEDVAKYRRGVTFYNGQLMNILGIGTEKCLIATRNRAIKAGWLHYTPGKKGKAGIYWVVVPEHASGLADTVMDEKPCDLHFPNGRETGSEREVKPELNQKATPLSLPVGKRNGKSSGSEREVKPPAFPTVPVTVTKEPPTPFQGVAAPSSENPSTDVAESGKPKRTRKGPVEAVTREVLRDTAKLVRWWRFASNCGLVDGTENSRLNVVGVACQVLASEAVRDPVAVFVATVRDKAWDRIGEAADEQARRRLKDFDAGKRAGNVAPEIAAALGKLAAAKASRATAEDLAAYGDGDCDE